MYPVLNSSFLEMVADVAIEHGKIGESSDSLVWEQEYYRRVRSCGTFLCLAGFACELTGGRWVDDHNMDEFLYAEPEDEHVYNYGEHKLVSAAQRANRLFGLTMEESRYLYDGSYNSAEELRHRVKRIINGEFR